MHKINLEFKMYLFFKLLKFIVFGYISADIATMILISKYDLVCLPPNHIY